jgi:hypothetical protein
LVHFFTNKTHLAFTQLYQTQLSPSNATMLQTPAPPSTITAAAAVAANASTIPLSPGRMPIAAIATAAAANASTIAVSPGGTPFTAMGLNIGRAKPLVTFAHPGVSSGQQNSGFSASLQPTIQSNLGSIASSVGGLGATCLGSINTTTGTSGSNPVPRKKGNSLMLSPYSGSIDPSSSTGIAKYINFVKLPYNEWLDCLVANCNLIFAGLAK